MHLNNCEICESLPDQYDCTDRFLVYQFTCKVCNEFYIGQTNRPFKQRFLEHKKAILKRQKTSALAEHLHNGLPNSSIIDFKLDILARCRDALDIID